MKGDIVQFPIEEKEMSYEEQSPKTNVFLKYTFIFFLILLLNIFITMDIGAIISYGYTDNYLYMLFPFTFIGNIICCFIPKKLIINLQYKNGLMFTLVLFIISIGLYSISFDYLSSYSFSRILCVISKILISFSQTTIIIFSFQWSQYFSRENNRLINIELLQISPILGIILGYFLEKCSKVSN